MSPGNTQLALQFGFNDEQVFERFDTGVNSEVLARIEESLASDVFAGMWIWGATGCGVTHLLNAACHRAGAAGEQVAYLPLRELPRHGDILSGLDACAVVAVDDLQEWLGDNALEAALMNLYQGAVARRGCFLCGANASARASAFTLPDLASRLQALPGFHVQPLDDAGKRRLLRERAEARGLQLSDQVLNFWLARADRSLPALMADLERIDAAALRHQRAVTVPLLKSALDL